MAVDGWVVFKVRVRFIFASKYPPIGVGFMVDKGVPMWEIGDEVDDKFMGSEERRHVARKLEWWWAGFVC